MVLLGISELAKELAILRTDNVSNSVEITNLKVAGEPSGKFFAKHTICLG